MLLKWLALIMNVFSDQNCFKGKGIPMKTRAVGLQWNIYVNLQNHLYILCLHIIDDVYKLYMCMCETHCSHDCLDKLRYLHRKSISLQQMKMDYLKYIHLTWNYRWNNVMNDEDRRKRRRDASELRPY